MKILYLITKSNWGGAQKYVFDLAINMRDRGHEVVVAFGGAGILKDKLEANNIRTIEIKNLERDVSILKEISVFKDIYSLLKKENPDIVHLNSSKIGAIGSLVARIAGIKKIIFTAHGWPFREERPFWQVIIISFISWLSVIFSHKTICVSQKDFDDMRDFPFVKDKIKTIHNGIEINDLELEPRLDLENKKVKIVSIGELTKNKGFTYAFETLNILKEKINNFSYTILTFGGEEKSLLENKIKELDLQDFASIYYVKKGEKASDMLRDFDIYFMPSIKEGLPYVLLEAGLSSLPIVASDTGGIKEIVDNYKNGFLINTKDINGFELALEKLITNKELRLEFGKNLNQKIKTEFSLEKMIKKTEDLYIK